MSEMFNSVQEKTSNLAKSAGDTFSSIQKSATDSISGVQSQIDEFSKSTSAAASNSGFFTANGLIAKFGFLILAVIIFLVLLNLGIRMIYYFMTPSSSYVYLIKGMIDGGNYQIISQDPTVSSRIVARSNNQSTGIEFTWSVWILLNGFSTTASTAFQPIFVKGSGTYNRDGIASISNGPGVYFSTGKGSSNPNAIRIVMDTMSNTTTPPPQVIDIPNIPIKKWFNLCIRCENKYLDVYMNGIVAYRLALNNVPLQNYNDVYVCGNGGFIGNVSNLLYYNRALNIVDINAIVSSGPNTSNADPSQGSYGKDYLSTLWYT